MGAFGPAMTRVAARHADEVVLNLVPPARVADMRAIIDAAAAAAGRIPPRLTVWVPVAVDPGDAARVQLAAQLAVYLAPPGYGEMFSELGFLDLVQRARAGAHRAELATAVPVELLDQVCALGSAGGHRRAAAGLPRRRRRQCGDRARHGRGPRRTGGAVRGGDRPNRMSGLTRRSAERRFATELQPEQEIAS